ncbi:MAG: DUF4271 domain-containing protein [Prevotella sp.]|nr:DUF4271 domain-containing protein [Prevotella sp.]
MKNVDIKYKGNNSTFLYAFIGSSSEVGIYSDSIIDLSGTNAETTSIRHEGNPIPFNIEHSDGVFGLLLLCFLFFAHVYNGGLAFLSENLKTLFSFNPGERIESTTKETLYSYFLIFQAIVLASVCLYDYFIEYDPYQIGYRAPLPTILIFILFIIIFLFIKDMSYRFIGFIFEAGKQMTLWRQKYIVSIEILGIIYVIPTMLLLYSNYYNLQIIVFMGILFLIVQLILFYQIIIFFISEKFNFLFLIAYLCTFEILPYFYLYKGLCYLYDIDVFNTLWL